MSSNELPVLVIGTGPAGLTAASLLIQNKVPVTLIDIGVDEYESFPPNELKRLKNLKSLDGSIHPYDWQNDSDTLTSNSSSGIFASKAKFGFSTVWGNTWQEYECLRDEKWISAYKTASSFILEFLSDCQPSEISDLCNCFSLNFRNSNKSKINIFPTQVAINKKNCTLCGNCQIKCNYNVFWDTKKLFEYCSKSNLFTYVSNFRVHNFYLSKGIVTVTNKGNNIINGKHLFIGAGPLNTSKILIRSGVADKITMKDTKICYLPLISISKNSKHPGSIALSSFSLKSYSDNQIDFYAQFYSHLNDSIRRISIELNKYYGLLVNCVVKIFSTRIRLSLIYFSPDISPRIILEKRSSDKEKLYLYTQGSFSIYAKLINLLKMFPTLFSYRLAPILIGAKWGKPGASYHYGCCEENFIDEEGRIKSISNVSVIGALALKHIEPGPITATVLAQTVISIESFLKNR
jgi:NAD-dependent dihydropyrimidine dehydrogenase PreA subunit